MKILVLSSKPPWPPHDGGAVATLRCIEGLIRNGASVSVLAMITRKHTSSADIIPDPPSAPASYRKVSVNTSLKPLSLLYNLFFSTVPYDLVRFRSAEFSARIRQILEEENFDIIQCEGLVFSEYLDEIRAITSTPVVLRAHNAEHRIRKMMAEQSERTVEKAYLRNLAARLRKREVSAANKFDAVIPISADDLEWFASVAPGKPMMLMEAGTDEMPKPPEVKNGYPRVGFIGALDWRPNAEGLLWFLNNVWPYVSKRMPGASFHIAGRNAPEKLRLQLTGRNVIFEGEVPDSLSFTSSMSIMAAPLFAGSGMRIKILEAMSLGKVVVATPVAAAGLPVTHRKDILIGEDQFMFSSAIIEALGRHDLRKEISDAAYELVRQKFNNRELTKQLLSFYNDLAYGR